MISKVSLSLEVVILSEYKPWIEKIMRYKNAQNIANFSKYSFWIICIGSCTQGTKSFISLKFLAKKKLKKMIIKSRGSFKSEKNISCFFI